jgi:hypothetical protein
MGGCYVVDYSFHETQALKPGYSIDPRVYDVNGERTAMEWIRVIEQSDHHLRLQHVLFLLDENGKAIPDSLIRHQAEDWQLDPEWVWEYQGRSHWHRLDTHQTSLAGQWVRRITNLDDGLRYQCLAPWHRAGERIEWSCGDNFAPIPGRETRDMQRKDYQALMRSTRVVTFPSSWLERQKNVKTLVAPDSGKREPLAEEVGRNWYVRAPDTECAEAARWTAEHLPFWNLLEETWATYFGAQKDWHETPPGHGTPRWAKLSEVEDRYYAQVAHDPAARAAAQKEIREIIDADRMP